MDRENFPKQTKFRREGEIGNCLQYCIAYILGVNPDGVPHFLEEAINKKININSHIQNWLYTKGYSLTIAKQFEFYGKQEIDRPDIICCGPTPRSEKMGQHHAVIYNNGRMVYDPHPDETGLTYISEEYLIFRTVT